jgi:hypothetical protein
VDPEVPLEELPLPVERPPSPVKPTLKMSLDSTTVVTIILLRPPPLVVVDPAPPDILAVDIRPPVLLLRPITDLRPRLDLPRVEAPPTTVDRPPPTPAVKDLPPRLDLRTLDLRILPDLPLPILLRPDPRRPLLLVPTAVNSRSPTSSKSLSSDDDVGTVFSFPVRDVTFSMCSITCNKQCSGLFFCVSFS